MKSKLKLTPQQRDMLARAQQIDQENAMIVAEARRRGLDRAVRKQWVNASRPKRSMSLGSYSGKGTTRWAAFIGLVEMIAEDLWSKLKKIFK